jgi:hypothetical protein
MGLILAPALRLSFPLAAALALAPPAWSADWYVNAVAGLDSQDGTSAATAWRTLSHGLAVIDTLPPNAHVLHVAPGTYDVAHGETFPLRPADHLRIVALDPFERPVVEGATAELFQFIPGDAIDERTGLTGIILRSAGTGVTLGVHDISAAPLFEELTIENMSGDGVVIGSSSTGLNGQGSARPTFRRVEIAGSERGIFASASGGSLASAAVRVTVEDGVIRDCRSDGIRFEARGDAFTFVDLTRCQLVRNGGSGAFGFSSGEICVADLDATACLIAENVESGLEAEVLGLGFAGIRMYGSTIAHNGGAGIRGTLEVYADLFGSIVAGNADDIDVVDPPYGEDSNCQDGDLVGLPGCIAVDPGFRSPAAGDYRLSWRSECLDSGDPDLLTTTDLIGKPRTADGDLDTQPQVDMGAFEFQPAEARGSAAPGELLEFTVYGRPGARVQALVSPLPLAVGVATPLGLLELDRQTTRIAADLVMPATGQLGWSLLVPDDPVWVGTTLAFQFLIGSPPAPLGAALSNAQTFTILP